MATPKKPATPRNTGRDGAPVPERMRQLYRRLSRAGFGPKFVREYVLPPAWQDEKAVSDAEYRRLLTFLSDHLGIDLASLQDPAAPLAFGGSQARLFRGRDVFEEADATQQVAQGVARVALAGLPEQRSVWVPPALVLRRQLLLEGRPWVGFRDLLSYCWRIHVPVLHVQNLPAKSTKHKGIAVEVDGTHAIVLCQQHVSPAWHLKALAHEIGHLTEEDADLMTRPATTEEKVRLAEQAETAAARYATQLMTGGREVAADTQQYRWTQDLVDATYVRAQEQNIDPGYLILRRGAVSKNWSEANAALRIIDDREGGASARELINSQILSHIDARSIRPESISFFQRVTEARLRTSSQPLSPHDIDIPVAGSLSPPAPGQPTAAPSRSITAVTADTYPEGLLTRYKALAHQRLSGGLAAPQAEELAALREQLQAISRRDVRGQEAARRVKGVNTALATLEAEVDTRIAQRRAELAESQKD